jgi:hypothetical protein
MIPYTLRDTVKDLYTAFSNQSYVPTTSWTTTEEFTLDPLYQHIVTDFVAEVKPPLNEFVLDTTLVPQPGIEPGSSDFQSAA